jgi:uracil-DNA glycosylase
MTSTSTSAKRKEEKQQTISFSTIKKVKLASDNIIPITVNIAVGEKNEVKLGFYDKLELELNKDWRDALKFEFTLPYWKRLIECLNREHTGGAEIYPAKSQIFAALNRCPIDKIKAIIIGQDPYHGQDQAIGLCFSVPIGQRIPPSLENIHRELKNDVPDFKIPLHGDLGSWADRGVLLLNSTLTVTRGKANSHESFGWSMFTDAVIKLINVRTTSTVFLLWGSFAQKKCSIVNQKKHCILKAPHPSPNSQASFLSCKHFSKANDYLKSIEKEPIDWLL